jgi:S-DNA-T family DNA segregation ATPase FtsK/SpoIIIE
MGAICDYLWQELKLYPQQNYQLQKPTQGPRVITLRFLVNPTYTRKIMAMGNELSMAAGLDKDYAIRIGRGRQGTLTLELPKPPPWKPLPITALPRRHRGVIAALGLDTENRVALVDFANHATAHILIAGATGSGKTQAGKLLTFDLAMQNDTHELHLILIDTKKNGRGWREFERLPHLAHPVITEDNAAFKVLSWGVAEVDRRFKEGQALPRIFFGIDEAQALLENERFIKPIMSLASVGREAGVHIALLTQNPSAAILGDASVKRNITARLVGRVDSPEAARVATGQPGTGAEGLTGTGDMLLIQPGSTRRLITALLTERDYRLLPRADAIKTLDLSPYEDFDHVFHQTNLTPGRNPDPLEPEHVYHALVEPDLSLNELYRRFSVGRTKAKAIKSFAHAILSYMQQDGYSIYGPESGTERNKIPDFVS